VAIPRVAGPLLRAIDASTAWLRELNAPAAVIGGVAASLLGRPRVTKDVDMVVLVDDDAWARALEIGTRHDVADIEAILEATPALDLTRVRDILRVFTDALAADDFAGEFERILARTRRR
jgi:hypothetical protein